MSMFDYIKSQVALHEQSMNPKNENDSLDSVVVECAHLFQELSDLSEEGLDSHRDRKIELDIPIEDDVDIDDVELTSVEFNLTDGRLLDVPMDSTLQEAAYGKEKTFEDFYQEATRTVVPFQRESKLNFHDRCVEEARKQYDIYQDHIIQEGLFGHDKIPFNDPMVPAFIMTDFGPLTSTSNQHYIVKLPTSWEPYKNNFITKQQLMSARLCSEWSVFENIAIPLMASCEKRGVKVSRDEIWNIATPKKLLFPIPKDAYVVGVVFNVDGINEEIIMGWSCPMKNVKHNLNSLSEKPENLSNISYPNIDLSKLHTLTADEFKADQYTPTRHGLSRWDDDIDEDNSYNESTVEEAAYQEAIDFGNSEESQNENNDEANQVESSSTDTPPELNTGENESSSSDKKQVNTNDVSDKIADKIASTMDEKEKDSSSEEDTLNNMDVDEDQIDQEINSLDDTTNTQDEIDDAMSENNKDDNAAIDIDVENMSIDDLLAQGAEKLKSMTISQLKSFVTDGIGGLEADNAETNSSDDTISQEAFIITKKNVLQELNTNIRKCLGVLNDNEMTLDQIVKEFKHAGKKLNRVLTKANKFDIFTSDEKNKISALNSSLVVLGSKIKSTKNEKESDEIKSLIKDFVAKAKDVVVMVEAKTGK